MTPRAPHPGDAAPSPGGHTPVMLREVLAALAPRDGGIYIDGTFGAGGYAAALAAAAGTRVYGIDRDPAALAAARDLVERYAGRLTVVDGRFGEMDRLLAERGVDAADGVALDLGVSSTQLDTAARGFSFRHDAPLDMRMDGRGRPSAADLINDAAEDDLADIIWRYGEERRSRRVARAIVAARAERRIERTVELAEIVRGAVGGGAKAAGGIDPATRTFQALRICVNDELGELARGLSAAERLLAPGGRLAVVAFHSLEDRIVKDFLKARSGAQARGPRHRPEPAGARPDPTFEPLFKGPCRPSPAECDANPRARSARLRAAARTAAPAWPAPAETAERPS